ncbi:MAG: hypothetical protein ACXWWT_11010 [Candidatus Deferrimicrobiaceae bacterium]
MREARRFNRYLFPGMVFIVLLVLYLFHSATGRPYPQSTVISGVHWRFDTVITYASGSDLWPATWAGDNNVYMTWGDGGGFGGSNTKCRTQFGMAKITNDPPSTLSTTNVYGCTSDGTGSIGKYTLDPACNASYASTIAAYGRDILAVDKHHVLHREFRLDPRHRDFLFFGPRADMDFEYLVLGKNDRHVRADRVCANRDGPYRAGLCVRHRQEIWG